MFPVTPRRQGRAGLGIALGGACGLIVAMGIGRFAFTAILPAMMDSCGFGEDVAGIMAAWNYAGYLIGALLMRGITGGRRRFRFFAGFLAASVVTTACMGLTDVPWYMHGIRFMSGLASGACFVLCSSIVFDALALLNRPVLAGFLYSGVGSGIAISGLASGPFIVAGGSGAAWLGLAAVSLPFALVSLRILRSGPAGTAPGAVRPPASKAVSENPAGGRRKYRLLLCAYFLEGFGYIIGTTFLVSLVQNTTNSPGIARASWIVTGCAAALTPPLWRAAVRKSYLPVLVAVFALQGVGVLLPVVSATAAAALGGGLILGGTFLGITVLSLQYGVLLSGKPSAHTVAVMTVVYGVGQILGPMVASGKGFYTAFIVSAISLFAGAVLLTAAHFADDGRRDP